MSLYDEIKNNIHNISKPISIVYPEGWNKDIQTAALTIAEENPNIRPILIFRAKSEIPSDLAKKVQTITLEDDLSKYANYIYEVRKHKELSNADANKLARQPNFLGSAMVACGDADGEICGIEYSTADTLRAALQIVKAKPGTKTVCSGFIMEKGNEKLVFGDSSVNINPNPEELATITKSLGNFAKSIALLNDVRVAMLSYSTAGSGKGESVDKVKEAYELVKKDKEFISKYDVFGEIQFDAAIDMNVMHKKAKTLNWKEPANVFVFPDINAGNIGYKIAQRLGKYQAIGPVIIGLNKPVNDLSRGARASDVVQLSYITALQTVNK